MPERTRRAWCRAAEATRCVMERPLSKRAALVGAAAVVVAVSATLIWPPAPRLVWNASASSPMGLYLITRAQRVRSGDMVLAWAPARARELAAVRHYLPRNVPLVKHAAAAAGDRVCARGNTLSINGKTVARRRPADPSGRTMPWWTGCHVLRGGDLFLLTPDRSSAFDGRYFGITRGDHVLGRARLVWSL